MSPQRLPLGYKKLLSSPSLVENLTDTLLFSVEALIIEDKPSESTLDQSQQVEMEVDLVLPLEDPPSDDIIPKQSENDTVQILIFNTESDELWDNPPVPSQQEENPPVPATQGVISPIYSVPPPSSLIASFDWNRLEKFCLPSNVPF